MVVSCSSLFDSCQLFEAFVCDTSPPPPVFQAACELRATLHDRESRHRANVLLRTPCRVRAIDERTFAGL